MVYEKVLFVEPNSIADKFVENSIDRFGFLGAVILLLDKNWSERIP